jgi:hypothetical protein
VMEGGKVRGILWLLAGWFTLFLVMCVILANISCMPPAAAEKPESGAICMTAEALDRQLLAAYGDGYAKAKAEAPAPADVELKIFKYADLMAFLKLDDCDRCGSELDCLDRAECLTLSARNYDGGYDSYAVVMNFSNNSAHAIVAFPTKDRGLVFIEPRYDQVVARPEVGHFYLSLENVIEKVAILR